MISSKTMFSTMLELEKNLEPRLTKWRRNFRAYIDSYRVDDLKNPQMQPLGLWFTTEQDVDRPAPVINATRSAVDTVCSTMSQLKTRPFVNSVNGKYKTRKVAKQVQRYIDAIFDEQKVYITSPEVLRHALVMEVGYYWVNDIDAKVEMIRPWEFFCSPAEWQFGKVTIYHLRFDFYPLSALEKYIGDRRDLKLMLERDPMARVQYRVAYNLRDGYRSIFINQFEVDKQKITFDETNVVDLYFRRPMRGMYSTSIVDDVYTIQLQINDICNKIGTATRLTPANFVLVPKSQGGIKPATIKSDIGFVYEWQPIPGVNNPIQIVTPAPIDEQYVSLLSFFIDQLFKQPGISDMQALGERPKSVQSGYAIDTMNNIFSSRQNVLLVNYIQMQCDLARKIIKCFPKDYKIPSRMKQKVTIGDVQAEMEMLTIDISASSSISRDPKTKQDQILSLIQSGLLTPTMAAQYLELPDAEAAYEVLTSAQDYNRWIVERVIEEGKMDFYQVTDMADLFQLAISELLQCSVAGDDDDVLLNLATFLEALDQNDIAINQATQVTPQPGQPVNPGVAPQPPPQGQQAAPPPAAGPQGVAQ